MCSNALARTENEEKRDIILVDGCNVKVFKLCTVNIVIFLKHEVILLQSHIYY